MQHNDTNKSDAYFTRCLGIYYLQVRPTGNTFSTYISVIVALSIFSVLSALGNGLIIYVYIKQKSLQRTNTLLLVCLAFLDFVSAVVLEPLYVVRLLSEIFGFTSCVYILIVRRLLEYLRPVSFMTLALITIERYLALFKAIIHRRMATKQRLLYVVLLIWFAWFLVILIRSFFPRITSAFYTFFTFVAFSLLMGNLIMYFKIGKLARLHSRPTRLSTSPGSIISTAPGSLTVGYKNPRLKDPGILTVGYENSRCTGSESNNSGVMYSKTEESVNYVENGKRRSLTNVGIQRSESGVKSTKINVQPTVKSDGSTESHVVSRKGEMSNASKKEIGSKRQEKNEQATDSEMFQNATSITASDKRVGNNSEKQLHNDKSNSNGKLHVKETNLETESDKNLPDSLDTVATKASICQHESSDVIGDIITHQVKTDINNNSTSTDLTEQSYDTFQATNIQQLQGNAQHKVTEVNTSPEFKNTSDGGSSISPNPDASDKIAQQATSHEKTIVAKDQSSSSQFKNTSDPPTAVTQTNKDTHQTTDRTKLTVETRERNATWTVFYIVAILTLSYSPIAALLVYLSFKQPPDATLLFIYVPIADTIALFNALVNPFIYCYKNRKMRVAVKSVLKKIWNGR